MDITTVAQIATIADKYGFYFSRKRISLRRMNELDCDIPSTINDDFIVWFWLSWVYRHEELFERMICNAIKKSKAPLSDFNIPGIQLPEALIDYIEEERTSALDDIEDILEEMISVPQLSFRSGKDRLDNSKKASWRIAWSQALTAPSSAP
ncbi:hypothetical protein BBP40_004583 [Aspergillus hancockii]|nr:hypothetical protein BBP40_004583 [Aspergillus hancockii]